MSVTDEAAAHCEREVRARDRDRFLAALYAPAERRPWLHALYAFDLDVAAIGQRVREPLAGEVRLQWWREVLEGVRPEEAAAHPVATALLRTVAEADLPLAPLQTLLEARRFDVYGDPMVTVAAFETYAAETAGAVIALAARALGAGDAAETAAHEAGIAATYAQALQQLPADSARGRLFLPAEVFAAHGVHTADVLGCRTSPALLLALEDICRRAETHLAASQGVPRQARPAFLHVASVPLVLAAMRRRGYDPFAAPIAISQWRRQWRLWRAARG